MAKVEGQLASSDDICATPSDGGVDLQRISINEGSKGWKLAAAHVTNLKNATQAIGKVKLENKIGKSASDLEEGDPLKTIALATQRALKSFGGGGGGGGQVKNITPDDALLVRSVEFDDKAEEVAAPNDTEPQEVSISTRQSAFRCFEMCHDKFRDVRAAFGISETQFYAVLGLQKKQIVSSFSVIGSGEASGKSPSFFFLSPDQRYILKSCTKRDVQTLTRILSSYRDHVKSCAGAITNADGHADGSGVSSTNSSLLPRYLGLYKLTFQDGTPDVTLVVMTNFFAAANEVHFKYDLKGSTYHREASEKERAKASPVYKDLDWMREGRKISFDTEDKVKAVRERLEKDTLYLNSQRLIDYSLLVGIHEIESGTKDVQARDEAMDVISARTSKEIQYFGLVDILTPYIARKRAETICTGTLICRPGISCQPPKKYQGRFMTFVDEEVLACTGVCTGDS
jgi:hypothetical protein